jgi:hypothetical protein
MKKNIIVFLFTILLFSASIKAQNVGVNATGAIPNASAMLDVSATNKGILVPQVNLASLTDATAIPNPANSLLVYNTNAAITGGAGYYYNSGTSAVPVWSRFRAGGQSVGQSVTNYFSTGSVSLNSIGTTSYLAGFPVTVNIPANCTVIMSISASAQTNGTAATNYSSVDILGYVDGAIPANGCYERMNIANSAGLISSQIRNASFSEAFTLAAGNHTFGIGAYLAAASSTATTGGDNTSPLLSTLTLTIIKN